MAPASALQGYVTTGDAEVTGTTMTKQGGISAWDSCVYSVNGYTTAHIAAKPIGTLPAMFGFSTMPAQSSSYTNGDYQWYNNAGTWEVYESGTPVASFAAVAATDVAEILYDDTTVTYLLNKVSQHTTSAPGLTLYAFVPLDLPGSGWNLVDFGPTTVTGVIDTASLGENAATTVFLGGVNTPGANGVAAGNHSPAAGGFALTTVGPPYDCTAIVTLTASAQQASGTPGDILFEVAYADDGSTYAYSTTQIPLTSGYQYYALQWQFDHLAANAAPAATYSIYNSGSIPGGADTGYYTVQVEYIKR